MPTVSLIYGMIGSGKTTFAKKLAEETGSVRFTLDEWMVAQHGVNPPAEKFGEYEAQIKARIWLLAEQCIQTGRDVILDFGFWGRLGRDEARARLTAMGAEMRLYAMECPEEEMLARTLLRTASMPPGALVINKEAFDKLKTKVEPLGEDEAHIVVSTSLGR